MKDKFEILNLNIDKLSKLNDDLLIYKNIISSIIIILIFFSALSIILSVFAIFFSEEINIIGIGFPILLVAALFSSISTLPRLISLILKYILIFVSIILIYQSIEDTKYLAYLIPIYFSIKGLSVISKINEVERIIMMEYWYGKIERFPLLLKIIGVPYVHLKYVEKYKYIISLVFFIVSISIYSAIFIFILFSPAIIIENYNEISMYVIIKYSLLIILLSLISFGFNYLGRIIVRSSIKNLINKDKRSPITYLRAFEIDSYKLKTKSGIINKIIIFLRLSRKLDTVMLDECSIVGPVISLGNPRDKIIPYGTSKYYANSNEWKNKVIEFINNSRLVYIFLQETDGVEWEINKILENNFINKTIFINPPIFNMDKSIYLFEKILNKTFISTDNKKTIVSKLKENKTIGFFFIDSHHLVILEGKNRNQASYLIAIRASLKVHILKDQVIPIIDLLNYKL